MTDTTREREGSKTDPPRKLRLASFEGTTCLQRAAYRVFCVVGIIYLTQSKSGQYDIHLLISPGSFVQEAQF
jgi:hypothetical protein